MSIRTSITLECRRFRCRVVKKETLDVCIRHVVLTKEQLEAMQLVGQSSKELLSRILDKEGFMLVDVEGKAERRSILLNLDGLWK